MLTKSWKAGFAAVALIASTGVGVCLALAGDDEPKKPEQNAAREHAVPTPKPTQATPPPANEDRVFVSPAKAGYATALRVLKEAKTGDEVGRAADVVKLWSQWIAEAETDPADPTSRRNALRGHLERMRSLVGSAQENIGTDSDATSLVVLNVLHYRAEAERLLKTAEAEGKRAGSADAQGGVSFHADEIRLTALGDVTIVKPAPVKDARTLAVLKALEERIEMPFKDETPFDVVLKYVREKTKSAEFPSGVPIYVDPVGLQEAEKTLTSPIAIDLEDIPLRRTLQLALKQLGMVYTVDDGLILIGAESSEALSLPPAIREQTPIQVLQAKAERGELSAAERKSLIEMLEDLRKIDLLIHPENAPANRSVAPSGMGGGLQ